MLPGPFSPAPSAAGPWRGLLSSLRPPDDPGSFSAWGEKTARALSSAVDGLVLPILSSLDPLEVGAYAVGGYGRGELAPHSDVDLLVVTAGEIDLSAPVARLWDLGIRPSLLVRGAGELPDGVRNDLKFATTLLDARHLFGMEPPLLCGPRRWIDTLRPGFYREHESERRTRHLKHRGAGFQEPHLRDGRGGLRDVQMRRWIAKARGEDAAVPPDLAADYAVLLGARIVTHLAAGRREDRLLLAERESVLSWLGWSDPDVFFKETLLAMKRIATGRPRRAAPRTGGALRDEFLRRLSDVPLRPVSGFLRLADESGSLGDLLPGWNRIEALPRNDAVHLYTPEEHTLRVVENLEALFTTRSRVFDADTLQRHDLLVLAALFHDIGKGSGRPHDEEGAARARDFMAEAGFAAAEIERVAFLVRHHHLLAHGAFMRDVDDPAHIHELARRIGDSEVLAMLYLLTVADMKAVSPETLSDWKARLLDTLAARLLRQCASYLPPDLFARETLARRRTAVEQILSGPARADEIAAHFGRVDGRYALAHTAEQIARHIELIPRLAESPVVIDRRPHPVPDCADIIVITRSHEGLFAEIAGTLSARGFNILSADISTRSDGIAIDSFRVGASPETPVLDDENRWKAFEKDLRAVIEGRETVARLIESRLPYARRAGGGPRPAGRSRPVVMDNESSPTHTVVEVILPDELGLLYRIASVFRDCGISITSAIVNTEGGYGVDVFYVADRRGRRIQDPAALAALTGALEALDPARFEPGAAGPGNDRRTGS